MNSDWNDRISFDRYLNGGERKKKRYISMGANQAGFNWLGSRVAETKRDESKDICLGVEADDLLHVSLSIQCGCQRPRRTFLSSAKSLGRNVALLVEHYN